MTNWMRVGNLRSAFHAESEAAGFYSDSPRMIDIAEKQQLQFERGHC